MVGQLDLVLAGAWWYTFAPAVTPQIMLKALPAPSAVLLAVVFGAFAYALLSWVSPSGLMPRA
jgi:hypothetical protein